MSIITKAALKLFFETGDKPTEAQFGDLIDSSLNLADNVNLLANNGSLYGNLEVFTTGVLTIEATWDELAIGGIILSAFGIGAAITASGDGGLDTGAEAADTWYYYYALSNADGSSIGSTLSINAVSPTLPPGFTLSRRIGAVRNNAASDFILRKQMGNQVIYDLGWFPDFVGSGQALVFTDVDLSDQVPETSERAIILLRLEIAHNVANVAFQTDVRPKGSTGLGTAHVVQTQQLANIFIREYAPWVVDTDSSQVVQYDMNVAPNIGGTTINVYGYYDTI